MVTIIRMIIWKLVKETALAIFDKLDFKVVAERTATRMVIVGLDKIEKLSTNSVTKEITSTIKSQLQGHRLKEIDEGWE